MKYRRTVGTLAALATVAGGSAFVALSGPSFAGSVGNVKFPASSGDSKVDVLRDASGAVSGLVPKGGSIKKPSSAGSEPKSVAKAHLVNLAPALGVNVDTLTATSATKVPGGTTVKFKQTISGLPVTSGETVVSLDKAGNLDALLADVTRGSLQRVKNPIGRTAGGVLARNYVAKKAKLAKSDLSVEFVRNEAFDPSVVGVPRATSVTREVAVYRVFNEAKFVDYNVRVDRGFKSVVLADSNIHEGLSRRVCDVNNKDVKTLEGGKCDGTNLKYTRSEGNGATGIKEADQVYDNLGLSAKWYASYVNLDVTKFITDSKESGGSALRATTRACISQVQDGCPMENAFWYDATKQMYYGSGFGGLDVTGHELSHGVTAHTSKLRYIYESGAINESMSDVFGELIDRATYPAERTGAKSWIIGDEFANDSLKRNMADPTKSGYPQPDRMTSDNWFSDGLTDSGGVHYNSGVGNKTAYLISNGDTFNGFTIKGLGLAKTFKIYWTAQNLLTSGADYKVLGSVLPIACDKNIGRTGSFLTKDDCTQVRNAVKATELYKESSAAPVTTPYCASGKTVKRSYFQGFDAKPADWKIGNNVGLSKTDFDWDYVANGKDSAMIWTQTDTTAGILEQTKGIKVPSNGLLRFELATEFGQSQIDTSGSKAYLQYNAGSGWKAASGLSGSVNPGAWKGHSGGWGAAKFNLASLAGKTVKFRFALSGTPSDGTFSVLNVDNFKVYTCQ